MNLTRPNVVAVVGNLRELQHISDLHSNFVDIVEIRVDKLLPHLDEIEEQLELEFFPTIITVRDITEGGEVDLSAKERIDLYKRFMKYAAFVDVEVSQVVDYTEKLEMMAVVELAKQEGVKIIGSHHQFGQLDLTQASVKKLLAGELAIDIFKISANCANVGELVKLMSIYYDPPEIPCSIMAMGPFGKVSRLLFAKMGSVLNYGSVFESVVPGQWPAERLGELIREL